MKLRRGTHYPKMPPMLAGEGETTDDYADRLTGADGTGRVPYNHVRNRQCALGWHRECSERQIVSAKDRRCQCPCHQYLSTLRSRT